MLLTRDTTAAPTDLQENHVDPFVQFEAPCWPLRPGFNLSSRTTSLSTRPFQAAFVVEAS